MNLKLNNFVIVKPTFYTIKCNKISRANFNLRYINYALCTAKKNKNLAIKKTKALCPTGIKENICKCSRTLLSSLRISRVHGYFEVTIRILQSRFQQFVPIN